MPQRLLHLLLVEDMDDDAELVVRALRQAGFDLTIARVQTAAQFTAALTASPELVICDHSLPAFSSAAALGLLRERNLDIPFIVVSGTIDEESAVTILRAGAHDFITKQNLARLGHAVTRELQEARNRAERREAQGQLQVQRDFLRLVIDSNPGVIFTKDRAGRFTLANRATAEIYATTPDELVGKRDRDFNPDAAELPHFRQADSAVLESGQPAFIAREAVVDQRTGRTRWFETRKLPIVVADGSPQVLGIGVDITERVAAEEALRVSEEQFRQAQKMEAVGQLAGGIAHDFNNLLTAILGYADLLRERVSGLPDVAADLEEIRKAGQRASGLTRQLLAFSRKQVLEPQLLDLRQVVTDVERILRRVIGEDVQLKTITPAALHSVLADPGQIEQALMNLAINARDAMAQGGTLTIELANATPPPDWESEGLAPANRCVALSVSDTGAGMSPEVRSRIFEPFFTTKAAGRGTGLGLSMVYGVVMQSGGCINVESEPNRGSRFIIYLPAVEGREAPKPALPALPGELRGSETILLVEDEPAIRDLVRKVLAGYGYTVLDAIDHADAMAFAERHPAPIHLLLSDIVMPHMSGPELAQHLVPLRPRMRVLYMSGFGNRLSTGFGAMSPAVEILHKPFTPERLASKVRECLNRDAVAAGNGRAGGYSSAAKPARS
jgi:PAS domain S-box-containing protein